MKLFSYHIYDKWSGDSAHGVVITSDIKQAEQEVIENYHEQYEIGSVYVYDLCKSVDTKEESIIEIYEHVAD